MIFNDCNLKMKTITSGIFLVQMLFHNACTCTGILFSTLLCIPSVILIFFLLK